MRTSTALAIIVLVALLLGGLFWYTMQAPSAPVADAGPAPLTTTGNTEVQSTTTQETTVPVVTLATSTKLGSFLVARNGMTLYLFAKDATNTSTCVDTCAQNWPPYIVSATEPIAAGAGISGLLSTIARDDGSTQITYQGSPLYFYKNDSHPGDTTGQGVNKVWRLVKP